VHKAITGFLTARTDQDYRKAYSYFSARAKSQVHISDYMKGTPGRDQPRYRWLMSQVTWEVTNVELLSEKEAHVLVDLLVPDFNRFQADMLADRKYMDDLDRRKVKITEEIIAKWVYDTYGENLPKAKHRKIYVMVKEFGMWKIDKDLHQGAAG